VWSHPKQDTIRAALVSDSNGMGAYGRDRTDAVAGPMNVRKNVMKFTFRGSRSKDNDTLGVVHRKVYTGRRTRPGDCCVGDLPMRKREGKTKSLKPGKREGTEANVLKVNLQVLGHTSALPLLPPLPPPTTEQGRKKKETGGWLLVPQGP